MYADGMLTSEEYLEHHGIKGQKWGVRRFQNADGSLTPAGQKRQAKVLTKQYNKASDRWNYYDYRKERAENSASLSRNLAKATDKGILKPFSKFNDWSASVSDRVAKNYAKEAEKHQKLAKAAVDAATKSGLMAKAYDAPALVDARYYGSVTQLVYRREARVKFSAPTDDKSKGDKVVTNFEKHKQALTKENQRQQVTPYNTYDPRKRWY